MNIQDLSKPLYLQVKESIEQNIRSKKFPVGSKLPSENALCEEFEVSRITIRKALELLENMGLIYSVHGKGTFVKKSTIDSNLQKISSFGETLAHMGYNGFTKITHYSTYNADDFEKMLRGVKWNKVCKLSLTGYSMNEPVVMYRSVIRCPEGEKMYEVARELEKQGVPFSTFDLYDRIGLEIGKVEQKVEAINADEETAGILKINPGDAVLVLNSVLLDKNMQPIEYKKGYYCTDKYTFNLNRQL